MLCLYDWLESDNEEFYAFCLSSVFCGFYLWEVKKTRCQGHKSSDTK